MKQGDLAAAEQELLLANERQPFPKTYAMLQAAAKNGWIDGERAMRESLVGIKRAGADFVLTYFAREMARLLRA